MNPIKLFKSVFSKEGTTFDRWIDKKLQAYGWRGFVAFMINMAICYTGLYYMREIATFFGSNLNEGDQITYQARMIVINKVAVVILILAIAKLVKQYASKEEREAYKEKMRKDALMEAEILERKEEKENIGQKAD